MTDTSTDLTDMERVHEAMGVLVHMQSRRGRRFNADYAASRAVVVAATKGQCRHTRRNNLRVARLENRAATRKVANTEKYARAKAARHELALLKELSTYPFAFPEWPVR